MANLLEISDVVYHQLWPNPTDETPTTLQEIISSARLEYAYQFLLWYWKEKAIEGAFNMPGNLYHESDPLPIVDNEMDISSLDIMSRLPNDLWLAKIGKLTDECHYIKSNVNQTQLLKEDDSLPETYKPYLILGKKIIFPKGTHSDNLTIIFAGSGKDIDDNIEVDDAIGALVKNNLLLQYGGKIGMEDKTNNTQGQT